MKQPMSKSNDRKIVKPYLMKINSKMFRNQQPEEPENLGSNYIIKNTARHMKCKSGNNFKGVGDYVKSYQVNMYPMTSPNNQGSFGKVSHKYANSISNLEFSESNFESHQIPPHFTIDDRKRELNLKYDIAINSLKEKSSIVKKNERIMSKYSREGNRKDEFQFALKPSMSSNSQQQKCLKFKKSQIQKPSETELYAHSSVESLPGKKKNNLNISKKIKNKAREYTHNVPYENVAKNK